MDSLEDANVNQLSHRFESDAVVEDDGSNAYETNALNKRLHHMQSKGAQNYQTTRPMTCDVIARKTSSSLQRNH